MPKLWQIHICNKKFQLTTTASHELQWQLALTYICYQSLHVKLRRLNCVSVMSFPIILLRSSEFFCTNLDFLFFFCHLHSAGRHGTVYQTWVCHGLDVLLQDIFSRCSQTKMRWKLLVPQLKGLPSACKHMCVWPPLRNVEYLPIQEPLAVCLRCVCVHMQFSRVIYATEGLTVRLMCSITDCQTAWLKTQSHQLFFKYTLYICGKDDSVTDLFYYKQGG